MQATGNSKKDELSDIEPVQLSFSGSVTTFQLEGRGYNAGIFISKALPRIVEEFSATLTATIRAADARRLTKQVKLDVNSRLRIYPVNVVVYGFLRDKEAVANILSDEDLFLQDPGEDEFDRRVKYVNAQYLLRPGTEMPPLGGLSMSDNLGSNPKTSDQLLGELERNQVLQVFESANGKRIIGAPNIEQSPRLASIMKR